MLTHLAQRDALLQFSMQRLGRRCGEQDLLAMCGRHDPRRAAQRPPEVIAIPQFRHAGMQPHSHFQRDARPGIRWRQLSILGVGPRGLQGALYGDARCERIRGGAEDSQYTIAGGLDDASAGRLDRMPQQCIMARKRNLHRLWMLLPQGRAALDVREQEGYRARGQRRVRAGFRRHGSVCCLMSQTTNSGDQVRFAQGLAAHPKLRALATITLSCCVPLHRIGEGRRPARLQSAR